ncbi:hypothetical protein M902_2404 [Bacteriovorax sp. BAL6_X]|uniref:hypothetical protein n=1 Tax=Bacteriovorax sp. BAL6_X TaxID=1201290 RepID=UPI000386B89D|nr:hypothetical protein [Bacteriovorax sp. BAL6_X]EPZ51861.1 hypothetical protein M902_2404 [Bacteriovorax sp. BAL6_X]
MKSLSLAVLFTLSALGANVSANSNVDSFVSDLKSLSGKSGKVMMNGEERGSCTVVVESDSDAVRVEFDTPELYANPVSVALLDSAELLDNDTLLVSTNSNRPGGDACGDFGGASNYKEKILIDDNSVSIDISYRCFLFKKNEINYTCELN